MGSCGGGHCWLIGGEDGEAGSSAEAHSSCRAMSMQDIVLIQDDRVEHHQIACTSLQYQSALSNKLSSEDSVLEQPLECCQA